MQRFAILLIALSLAVGAATIAVAGDGHDCGNCAAHTQAAADQAPSVFDEAQAVGAKATCPVSGKEISINDTTPHSEYDGKHVYFCCGGCKPKFDENPAAFLKEKS